MGTKVSVRDGEQISDPALSKSPVKQENSFERHRYNTDESLLPSKSKDHHVLYLKDHSVVYMLTLQYGMKQQRSK